MIFNYDYGKEKFGEGDLRIFARKTKNITVQLKSLKNKVYFVTEMALIMRGTLTQKKS